MADKIRMDSHKLIFHPDRVAAWLRGENIYPIELEVGLTNACNHRCIFCAVDYTGYQAIMADGELYKRRLEEFAEKGVKSIIYAGEGEPLLHRDAPEIINRTKSLGIDAAMSTNGVLLTPEVSKDCLKSLTWIRFSTAAITEATYEKIHQCKAGDLQKVLQHMEAAVRVKKDQNLKTTLGVQMLLLPDNKDEVVKMAKEMKRIGVDYFTVKPFSQHPQSGNILQVNYQEMLGVQQEIKELQTEEFKIYFRAHSMEKLVCERGYKQCLALPFMVYIDAHGNLWPCIVFMGKEELSYGNIYKNTFAEIWEGERRAKLVEQFMQMDLEKNCRELCRLDEMNKYLDELRHPGEHVNFI
ncbi:radical SAM additional 4Fe4S-binding SPASM domain-containing protein [Lachnospiraceae bacterium XBB1006]|nr:radical SAM additional 4Fe4S-binding SPASM domain-containing protein [Lachnospiraceae bacterium XBB1006]